MPKGLHALSDLKRAYSVARGIPLRTAQHRAKVQHADWMAFVAAMGCQAIKAEKPTPPEKQALGQLILAGTQSQENLEAHIAPPCMSVPREMWTPEQYAEAEAWAGLVAANAQRNAAMERGDSMTALAFVKVAAEAQKSYHVARRARVQADLEAGRLKPMSAWQSAKTAVLKIASMLVTLEGDLAQTANPDDPHFALKAIGEWKERKWNPAVESALRELGAAA